jgi:hypothetical protein
MPLHIANKAIMKGEIPPEKPAASGRGAPASHSPARSAQFRQKPRRRRIYAPGTMAMHATPDGRRQPGRAMLCRGPHGHLNPYGTVGNFTFCP